MKDAKTNFRQHLFICTNKREDGDDCFSRGGNQLVDHLKKYVKENKIENVKVTRSGCLGKCSEGIAISCYPQGSILTEVSVSDLDELKKRLKEE